MKNLTRAFVVVLALTGAAAAAHNTVFSIKSSSPVVATKATAFPIPSCPMDDPNGCGIAGPNVTEKK